MCTIAMFLTPNGHLILAGNRDEMRTRKRALPPREPVTLGETTALFPTDADAGGTWIGVNASRIAITLLNNYQQDARFTPGGEPVSRGLLVKALLGLTSLEAIEEHLRRWPLEHTRPFILAAGILDAPHEARAIVATWSGEALELEERTLPVLLISSSFELERAVEARARALAPLTSTSPPASDEAIIELFSQHDPAPGPFTVSMSREDAQSVSHTWIGIDPNAALARMIYLDGPPHTLPARHEVELALEPSI